VQNLPLLSPSRGRSQNLRPPDDPLKEGNNNLFPFLISMTQAQPQWLKPLGSYWLSQHAYQRMRQRHISPEEILDTITVARDYRCYFPTREGRMKYCHPGLDINLIVDELTRIIITVTENDTRKNRCSKHCCIPLHWPPSDYGRSYSPTQMVTLVA
jgi:hypothetical protein